MPRLSWNEIQAFAARRRYGWREQRGRGAGERLRPSRRADADLPMRVYDDPTGEFAPRYQGNDAMTDPHPISSARIIQDPAILSGKPVIRGTRIPVEVILEYLAHNPDFDELFADYPRLTIDDVKAALAYAQHLVQVEATPTPR